VAPFGLWKTSEKTAEDVRLDIVRHIVWSLPQMQYLVAQIQGEDALMEIIWRLESGVQKQRRCPFDVLFVWADAADFSGQRGPTDVSRSGDVLLV